MKSFFFGEIATVVPLRLAVSCDVCCHQLKVADVAALFSVSIWSALGLSQHALPWSETEEFL